MSSAGVTIDGTDLGDYGFTLSRDASGWHDSGPIRHETRPIPERYGSMILSDEPAIHPLDIQISGWQKGDNPSDLRSKEDELKALLMDGRLEVIFDSRPERLFKAYLDGRVEVDAIGPRQVTTAQRVRARLIAPDPLMYSTTQYSIGLSKSAVPQGTGPVSPLVKITGAVDNPEIIYRDGDGNEVSRTKISASIPSGETWEVDMDAQTIKDDAGNGKIGAFDGPDWITMHGKDVTANGDPTLEVTPEPGGGAEAIYRKSYLP